MICRFLYKLRLSAATCFNLFRDLQTAERWKAIGDVIEGVNDFSNERIYSDTKQKFS